MTLNGLNKIPQRRPGYQNWRIRDVLKPIGGGNGFNRPRPSEPCVRFSRTRLSSICADASQAGHVHDSVRDTYSKNGILSEDQAKTYVAMLGATAGLKGGISANSIFDFSLAANAAKEMTGR